MQQCFHYYIVFIDNEYLFQLCLKSGHQNKLELGISLCSNTNDYWLAIDLYPVTTGVGVDYSSERHLRKS